MTLPVAMAFDRSLRVLVVDDRHLVRKGLRLVLADLPQIDAVHEAGAIGQARASVASGTVDVVLLDNRLHPPERGRENGASVDLSLGAPVVVTSVPSRTQDVERLVRGGASGFLVREAGLADLEDALMLASLGGSFLCPSISRNILASGDKHLCMVMERTAPRRAVEGPWSEARRRFSEGMPLRRVFGSLEASNADGAMAVKVLVDLCMCVCPGKIREAVSLGLLRGE